MKKTLVAVCAFSIFSIFPAAVLAQDSDGDGVSDRNDNCVSVSNSGQEDLNWNAISGSLILYDDDLSFPYWVAPPGETGNTVHDGNKAAKIVGNNYAEQTPTGLGLSGTDYNYLRFWIYLTSPADDLALQINCSDGSGWDHKWGFSGDGTWEGEPWSFNGIDYNLPVGQWTPIMLDLPNDISCDAGSIIYGLGWAVPVGKVAFVDAAAFYPAAPLGDHCEDSDGDGFNDAYDCEPLNQNIYPNATEICDGMDNQCAGDPGFGFFDTQCNCGNPAELHYPDDQLERKFQLSKAADGSFVLVAQGSGLALYAQRVGADGDTIGPPVTMFESGFDCHFLKLSRETEGFKFAMAYDTGGDIYAVDVDISSGDTLIPIRLDGAESTKGLSIAGGLIAWSSDLWVDWNIYARNGITGADFMVNDGATSDSTFPYLAEAPDGSVVAAWLEESGPFDYIHARRIGTGGELYTDQFRVDQGPPGVKHSPVTAVDSRGVITIAFVAGTAGDGIYARRFDMFGTPLGDQFQVSSNGPPYDEYADEISIAVDSEDNVLIAWVRGSTTYIRSFSPEGDPIGDEYQVLGFGQSLYLAVNNQDKPFIAVQRNPDLINVYLPSADTDCDGVLDFYENSGLGGCMDPLNPDSDGDWLCDGPNGAFDGPAQICRAGEDMDADGFVDPGESSPCLIDTDGDGFYDGYEVITLRTDPTLADSDGDGLNDWAEVYFYGTNPALYDTDGDGISDTDEWFVYLTDPLEIDTDGDGLGDFSEVRVSFTDPLDWDSDDDGVSDGEEEGIGVGDPDGDNIPNSWESSHACMDPGSNDATGDYDGDGSSNIWEYRTGLDPCNPDTDGDGLCDWWLAVGSTCWDGEQGYGTDKHNPDTDGDGLKDGEELFIHATDPLDPDSDGDGYSDGAEVAAGTDPNLDTSYPQPPQHLVNYQGRLTDAAGISLGDTIASMTFRIFDVLSGGTALWEEPQSVQVTSGIYNVLLGSQTDLDPAIFGTSVLYLEVEVNGEALSPRQRITSVPMAIKAEELLGGRLEMDTRALVIGAPVDSVTVHVSFNRIFSSPPQVMISPLSSPLGGQSFVAAEIENITATGFEVTFRSLTGAGASGSASFSYMAFGE